MKKLMIMLAAIALGFAAQAAVAVTWQSGTGVKDATGASFTTANTAYTATIAFYTDAACTTEFAAGGVLSTTTYATKGSKGFGGVTGETFDGGTYYAVLTIANATQTWSSDVASFTIVAGELNSPTINFTSGANLGGSSLINSNPYTAIPEPTSGLLALVGFAALALRRRRA